MVFLEALAAVAALAVMVGVAVNWTVGLSPEPVDRLARALALCAVLLAVLLASLLAALGSYDCR